MRLRPTAAFSLALLATGYQVFTVHQISASRYEHVLTVIVAMGAGGRVTAGCLCHFPLPGALVLS